MYLVNAYLYNCFYGLIVKNNVPTATVLRKKLFLFQLQNKNCE